MTGSSLPPLCRVCTRLREGTLSCDAFPEGIPATILAGERHIDLVPGDHGFAFRKSSGEPSLFIAGIRPETLFRVTVAGSYERYVPVLDLWELDNEFIRYVLATDLPVRPVDETEADALIERNRECLDAMNPCMREVRRMMYVMGGKHDRP
jgi:hypothetical protein